MKKYLFFTLIFFCASHFSKANLPFSATNSISVIKNNDTLYNAWAGGLNYPLFSSIDLNGDNLKDIFVFDRSNNRISTYINTGQAGLKAFRYDAKYVSKFPNMRGWAYCYDYNCDGKEDLFALSSQCACGIMVYRNDFSVPTGLQFTLVEPLVRETFFGISSNPYSNAFQPPGIADMDNDGDLDLVTFPNLQNGRLEYHKNLSIELFGHCDSLKYEYVTGCWGNFGLAIGSTNRVACFNCPCFLFTEPNPTVRANELTEDVLQHDPSDAAKQDDSITTIKILDMDGDSDIDALIGDIGANNSLYVRNGGNNQTAEMDIQDTLWPVNNVPVNVNTFVFHSYIDADNDNIKDVIAAAGDGNNFNAVWLYKNQSAGIPIFQFETTNFLQGDMIDVGSNAVPVFFDYDADGLLDIVIGNFGYYEPVGASYAFRPRLALYKNIGTSILPAYEFITDDYASLSAFNPSFTGTYYPAFGDLDSDGDQDLLLGAGNGQLYYFSNTAGAGNVANFVSTTPQYFGINVQGHAAPQIVDLNRDGLLDLVIGNQKGLLKFYQNQGSSNLPFFTNMPTKDTLGCLNLRTGGGLNDGYTSPYFYDEGGVFKLMVGCMRGSIYQYENIDSNLTGCFTLIDSLVSNLQEGYKINKAAINVSGGDFNADGKVDLLVGNEAGGIKFYHQYDPLAITTPVQIKGSVEVFPQPFDNYLTLKLYNDPSTRNLITIYNMLGIIVDTKTFTGNQTQIHLELPPGTYILKVNTSTQQYIKKIIKNR